MDFRLLGPLEVVCAGRTVRLGGARERSVLAILLLNANGVVAVDSLVDQLWPDVPPESAVHAVHVSISRLRRVLDDRDGRRIETRKPGYLLRVEPGELDLWTFQRLCHEAREHAFRGDPESASTLFAEASALWRGPPLADLRDEPFAQAITGHLAEARMEATEGRIAADLELGRHATLIAELEELTAAHPLRERLRAQLMSALYGCGRQADALAVFRETRALLIDELGIEPGAELREAEASILAGETERDQTRPGVGRPAQLPMYTASFTGRTGELDRLLSLVSVSLDAGVEGPLPPIAICAIDGMAGIGKTTLALRAAHLLADQFPDGCLFIDLHGHTEKIAPVDPGQALDRLLHALGVPGDRIPADPEDRAALYRSELAGRRVLVLLDNARDASQVRPLIPGAPGCPVLITSRRRLSGLDDATVLSLDVLDPADAVTLFGRVAGGDRVAGHDDAIRQIVDLCGRLPLAVRIAAARLRHRPMWTPEEVADRLAREYSGLGELSDSDRSVAAAFAVSYRDLNDDQRRMFRLIGLHPGSDLEVYAAAALAGTGAEAAERLLEDLLDAHLLGQAVLGRYRFHDLMRAYAARLASEQDADADRDAALTRLLDYYLHTTSAAVGRILPSQRRRAPSLPPTTLIPPIVTTGDALAWLEAERATTVSVIANLNGRRWAGQLSQLARILSPFLRNGAYGADALIVNGRALDIAHSEGDRVGEAAALDGLAWDHIVLSQFGEAFNYGQRALAAFRELGDGVGQCSALNCLGYSVTDTDRDAAAAYFQQALAVARAAGDDEGEGRALNNLAGEYEKRGRYRDSIAYLSLSRAAHERAGNTAGVSLALCNIGGLHIRQGRDEEALDCLRQALALAQETGFRLIQWSAMDRIGELLQKRGRYADAVDHHRQALEIVGRADDEEGEADVLVNLGGARYGHGDSAGALVDLRRAVALADRTHNRGLQARALNTLGGLLLAVGQPDEARRCYEQALSLSTPDIDRYEEARALDGLAACHHQRDVDQAGRLWLRASAIYTDLEVPEAEVVRVRLLGLTGQPIPTTASPDT